MPDREEDQGVALYYLLELQRRRGELVVQLQRSPDPPLQFDSLLAAFEYIERQLGLQTPGGLR